MISSGDSAKEFRESEWVDATTAAQLLGKSRPQVSHYAKSGQLTSIRRYGRLFVSREELAAFVPRPIGYRGHQAVRAELASRSAKERSQ